VQFYFVNLRTLEDFMILRRVFTRLCLFSGLAFVIAGCSGSATPDVGETAPVSGVVNLDGQPFPGATVVFVPQHATGHQGMGVTDDQGKYSASVWFKGKVLKSGLTLGPYKVKVTKWVLKDGSPLKDDGTDPMISGAHEAAPHMTANEGSSGLEFTVKKEGGTYNIDLKSN
jgi:hypothetical protein